jgi:inhibitor-of-growth protein 2
MLNADSNISVINPTSEIVDTILHGNNNFVSTLDHLPCDITRSLWFIQTLNLKNKRFEKLLYKQYQLENRNTFEINKIQKTILKNYKEAITESQFLITLITNHLNILNDDLEIIEILKLKLNGWTSEAVERRWKEWADYKKHYLQSQKTNDDLKNEHDPFKNYKIDDITEKPESKQSTLKIKINLKNPAIAITKTKEKVSPITIKTSISKKSTSPVSTTKHEILVHPAKRIKKIGKPEIKTSIKSISKPEALPSIPAIPAPPLVIEEEKYCFCNGPSFGRMVACEYENCPHQWFHFKCVGLTHDPTGEWFCSDSCRKKFEAAKLRKKQKKKRKHW